MRIAKFTVPVVVLTEFLDYINSRGLKSTIVSKKEDVYHIEIPYTKEQESIIDEMEELVDVLVALVAISITALSYLAIEVQKNRTKKSTTVKSVNKNYCFFKDFVNQNVKK